jgi:hypothetical protein
MTLAQVLAVLVVLAGGVFFDSAWSAETADELATEGIRLRRAGRDFEALPLFRKALEQKQTPKAYAQLGLCEQAVGLWVDAEEHLEQGLRKGEDPWITKNEAVLREALGVVASRLGSIEIWGEPMGASVSVDDRPVGRLPMERPARATAGQHALLVEAPGFTRATRTVEVTATKLSREQVVLVPLVGTAPKAIAPDLALQRSALARSELPSPAHVSSTPPTSPGADPFYARWGFWAIVGAVVVAGGVAAYLLTRGNDCSSSPMGGTCEGWK